MSDLELEFTTPEDETVPTIMLIDDDGKEEAHQILSWMEYEGREFAVLCPVDIEEGAEVGNGVNFTDLTIGVSEAKGEKCPRCWMHSVNANAEGLCPRCAAVIAKMDVEL